MQFSLVTFNAFGTPFYGSNIKHQFLRTKISHRFKKIGQLLNDSGADVLCFQEVFSFRHLNRLKVELTKYPYCVYQKFLIAPRGGLIIFSKHPVKKFSYIDFTTGGKYWDRSITSRLTKRGALVITFENLPLTIINTHPVQNSSGRWDSENKYVQIIQSQLDQLIKICNEINGDYILAGDFNMPHDSNLYAYFQTQLPAVDVFKNDTRPTYIEEYLFGKRKAERLDYIFYNGKHLALMHAKHVFNKKVALESGVMTYLSDHIALKADFTINV